MLKECFHRRCSRQGNEDPNVTMAVDIVAVSRPPIKRIGRIYECVPCRSCIWNSLARERYYSRIIVSRRRGDFPGLTWKIATETRSWNTITYRKLEDFCRFKSRVCTNCNSLASVANGLEFFSRVHITRKHFLAKSSEKHHFYYRYFYY